MRQARHAALFLCGITGIVSPLAAQAPEPGLLFYLSGEKGTTADYSAAGKPEPTFDSEVKRIADGARGAALECGNFQQLAWRAPGNLYAQRGTLAFFWRSRYPVGPTEFPIFRAAYADHSSHDMVWLRIDYNGRGFDAFVTDASLARTRVSVGHQPFPAPAEWVHLALAWDESRGIRFYVNGALAASRPPVHYGSGDPQGNSRAVTVYDTGLDQFGFHSRLISPHRVVSADSYIRGGDVDELRIYDRMLDDSAVARLASRFDTAESADPRETALDERTGSDHRAWLLRHGWEGPDAPPYYPESRLAVRKVEIHDAYDLRRWWWKANDGIRETTWPGVYNRSRLPGRRDYFPLPDWDCYVGSGQAITFALPEEPANHLEIAGAAWGTMELLPRGTDGERASEQSAESALFQRQQGRHKSVHRLREPLASRQIRFVNAEQEQPIGELGAYHVAPGAAPVDADSLTFRFEAGATGDPAVAALVRHVADRFPADERAMLVGRPTGPGGSAPSPVTREPRQPGRPLVHLVLPNTWDERDSGLDGVELQLPALAPTAAAGALIPLNIRVKDPLWPDRDLLDFTFSVKPGEARTLWLDLRDRMLPPGKALWIALASANPGFGADALHMSQVRLVFKARAAARIEHERDRFTQVKDCFAMLVEANPFSPKLNLWVRFETDLKDLLRVNPEHELARRYLAVSSLRGPRPPFTIPPPPPGVPRWAFLQTQLLERTREFILWYIERRQVPYGDLGGGISDDTDLTNLWPGIALMGCEPEKVRRSLLALLEAAYRNGMFTNGLPTIQADQLHSYEEGVNCLGQSLLLDFGSPRLLERAMETARSVAGLTGINRAGHRHFRTSYYSATRMASEDPWGATNPPSYLILHPGLLLTDFNGSPEPKRIVLELAEGVLAHRRVDPAGRASAPRTIRFDDDSGSDFAPGYPGPWHVLWAAWQWTKDERFLAPLLDNDMAGLREVNANVVDVLGLRARGADPLVRQRTAPDQPHRWVYARPAVPRDDLVHWQLTGEKAALEKIYAGQLEAAELLEYFNTEGSLWIDRVGVPTAELQYTRLGGTALIRGAILPGHVVSWAFAAPADERSVGILIPDASPTGFTVIAHNLERTPVRATMTGWNIKPGRWEIVQGVDRDGDDVAEGERSTREEVFERSRSLEIVLPPGQTTVLQLRLKAPGTPYWSRPDLGIDPADVQFRAGAVDVRVHGLGGIDSPATRIGLRAPDGRLLATATVPPLRAPVDLAPKTAEVSLVLPAGLDLAGCSVEIDPDRRLEEITRRNNIVSFPHP